MSQSNKSLTIIFCEDVSEKDVDLITNVINQFEFVTATKVNQLDSNSTNAIRDIESALKDLNTSIEYQKHSISTILSITYGVSKTLSKDDKRN